MMNGACANTSWCSSTRHEVRVKKKKSARVRHSVESELAGRLLLLADSENQFLSTLESSSFEAKQVRQFKTNL